MILEVTQLGPDNGRGLREITYRITNQSRKTAKQLRLTLYYLGNKGEKLKEVKTSIFDPAPSLTSGSVVELVQPAFSVPRFTERVVVQVDTIRFEDGSEWQR